MEPKAGQDRASTEVTSVSQKPCKGQKGGWRFFVSSAGLIRDMLRGRSALLTQTEYHDLTMKAEKN